MVYHRQFCGDTQRVQSSPPAALLAEVKWVFSPICSINGPAFGVQDTASDSCSILPSSCPNPMELTPPSNPAAFTFPLHLSLLSSFNHLLHRAQHSLHQVDLRDRFRTFLHTSPILFLCDLLLSLGLLTVWGGEPLLC